VLNAGRSTSKGRVTAAARMTPPPLDPLVSARAAHLRYVDDSGPGCRRVRRGHGFSYLDASAKPIRDPREIERIRRLVIPPAWTDVWICPSPNGHIQATGRDARGRKQYRYHPRWREVRDETKYHRMVAFGEVLPRIRAAVDEALRSPTLSCEKVLAAVVRLLEVSLIRVGNEEYARANRSFGLTTLREHQVDVDGPVIHFHFRGKGGIEHAIDIRDRRLARIVQRCADLPGEMLFQYVGEDGLSHPIESADVNEHIRKLASADFSAKDFRTWGGTVLAARALCELEPASSRTALTRSIAGAIRRVARRLGNTPAICRKCYVHPAVIEAYSEGRLAEALARAAPSAAPDPCGLTSEEKAVLALLRATPQLAAAA
jgi:DNA topoisomerase-1